MKGKKGAGEEVVSNLGHLILSVIAAVILLAALLPFALDLFDIRSDSNKEIAQDTVNSISSFVNYNEDTTTSVPSCFASMRITNQEIFQRSGADDKEIVVTGDGLSFKDGEGRLDDRVFFIIIDSQGSYTFPITYYPEVIAQKDFDKNRAVTSSLFDQEVNIKVDRTGLYVKAETRQVPVCPGGRDPFAPDSATLEESCQGDIVYEEREVPLEDRFVFTPPSFSDITINSLDLFDTDFLILYPQMGLEGSDGYEKGDPEKEIGARYSVQYCSDEEESFCGYSAHMMAGDYASSLENALSDGAVTAGIVIGVGAVFLAPASLIAAGLIFGGVVATGGAVTDAYFLQQHTEMESNAIYLVYQPSTNTLFSPFSDASEIHTHGLDCSSSFLRLERDEARYQQDFSLTDYMYREQIVLGWTDDTGELINTELQDYYFVYESGGMSCIKRGPEDTKETILSTEFYADGSCEEFVEDFYELERQFCFSFLQEIFQDDSFCVTYESLNEAGFNFAYLTGIETGEDRRGISASEHATYRYLYDLSKTVRENRLSEINHFDMFFDYPVLTKMLFSYYEDQQGELEVLYLSPQVVEVDEEPKGPVSFTSLFEPYQKDIGGNGCAATFVEEPEKCFLGKQIVEEFDFRDGRLVGTIRVNPPHVNIEFKDEYESFIYDDIKYSSNYYDLPEGVSPQKNLLNYYVVPFDETFHPEKSINELITSIIIDPEKHGYPVAYFHYDYPSGYYDAYEVGLHEQYIGGGFYRFREDLLKRLPSNDEDNPYGFDFVFNGMKIEPYPLVLSNSDNRVEVLVLPIPRVQIPYGQERYESPKTINVLLTLEQANRILTPLEENIVRGDQSE